MKTVGIVGGLGPESTMDYYRLLISGWREQTGEDSYPQIVLISLDVARGLRLVTANQLSELADYLADAVQRLECAGADFGLISANTPHLVFDEVRRRSSLPLISIVEASCAEVKARALSRVALLGTRFTMQAGFYPEVFAREGLAIVTPHADEQAYIHDIYVNELLHGTFLPETRERLLQIISAMKERDRVGAVLLAGTELPLILRQDEAAGVPLLDTTRIHVAAALARLRS